MTRHKKGTIRSRVQVCCVQVPAKLYKHMIRNCNEKGYVKPVKEPKNAKDKAKGRKRSASKEAQIEKLKEENKKLRRSLNESRNNSSTVSLEQQMASSNASLAKVEEKLANSEIHELALRKLVSEHEQTIRDLTQQLALASAQKQAAVAEAKAEVMEKYLSVSHTPGSARSDQGK